MSAQQNGKSARPRIVMSYSVSSTEERPASITPPGRKTDPGVPTSTSADMYRQRFDALVKQKNKICLGGIERPVIPSELKPVNNINYGSCGDVKLYMYLGMPMAVKEMKLAREEDLKKIVTDLEMMMKAFACPYIVKAYGYLMTEDKVMLCMENMVGCLDTLLDRAKNMPFPEKIIGKIADSVVTALHYLKKEHNVIHRDVKPSNILFDYDGNIKLCDFGISGTLVNSKVHTVEAGCPPYMAPERVESACASFGAPTAPPPYDVRSDVWSLGVSLVELATGNYPWKELPNNTAILIAISSCDPPRLSEADGFSADFVDFVSLCLTKDVNVRPQYPALLEHPFLVKAKDTTKETYVTKEEVAKWFADAMLTQREP